MTRKYTLRPSPGAGKSSVPSRVTYDPRGGPGEKEVFEILLPISTQPWPDLPDVPSEPLPSPSADPDFGEGPCGRAADRLWEEHVERFQMPPFRPSAAEEQDLLTRAERCRRAMPTYRGICGSAGEAAWAECFVRRGLNCAAVAEEAIVRCLFFSVGETLDQVLGGHRRDLIDLEP